MSIDERGYRRITMAWAAGWLCMAIGLMVLGGWVTGVSWVRSLLPGAVEMKANAAVGFLLAGAALCLLEGEPGAVRRGLGRGLGWAVAVLGLVTLADWTLGTRWGIGEVLFRDPTGFRGRMSAFAAGCFLLVGSDLAAPRRRPFRWLGPAAGGGALLVGGVSLVGYLWDASELVTGRFVPPLALTTALAFIVLGLGTVFRREPQPAPPGGAGRDFSAVEGRLLAGFAGAVVLLVLAGGQTYRAAVSAAESARWVAHTQQVRASLGGLAVALSDAELEQRNYLLTGDPAKLAACQRLARLATNQIQTCAALVSDNTAQLRRLKELQTTVDQRLAALDAINEVYRRSVAAAAREAAAVASGPVRPGGAREVIGRMTLAEDELLEAREAHAGSERTKTLLLLLGTLALAVAGYVVLFNGIRGEMGRRAQAEESLRRSEERLKVTLNSIGDAVLATDAQRRVTRLNPIAERLTGWSEAEACGRPVDKVFRIIHEKSREPATIPVDEVLATGEIHGLANHTALVARDGTERPIADSAAPIRDRNGQILGVVLVFRDVTEERRAEEEILRLNAGLEERVRQRTAELVQAGEDLRASEERFRQLAEHSSEGFWFVAASPRRMLYVSPAVERIWGVSAERFYSDPELWFEAVHEEDRSRVRAVFEECLAGRQAEFEIEYRVRRPDGALRCVLDSGAPVPDARGGFSGCTEWCGIPRRGGRSKRRCCGRSGWKASARSPAASRTTSTTPWRPSSCRPRCCGWSSPARPRSTLT